jgi:hypothetical protein
MDKWLTKIRSIRQVARDLGELEAYLSECVASEKVMQAIFSDEPPKRRSRRRTTATQAMD